MTGLHVLYRFYNATGQLLYVGITSNPAARFKAHQAEKTWSTDIRGITLEYYQTRDELLQAEARAIRIEAPQHNVIHNQQQRPRQTKSNHTFKCVSCRNSPTSTHFITETLKVVCNECAFNAKSKDIHNAEYDHCSIIWHDLWDHELIQSPSLDATNWYLKAVNEIQDDHFFSCDSKTYLRSRLDSRLRIWSGPKHVSPLVRAR